MIMRFEHFNLVKIRIDYYRKFYKLKLYIRKHNRFIIILKMYFATSILLAIYFAMMRRFIS
jgi:hypothetical protein